MDSISNFLYNPLAYISNFFYDPWTSWGVLLVFALLWEPIARLTGVPLEGGRARGATGKGDD